MNRFTLTLIAVAVIVLAAGGASQLVASDTPVAPALPHAACLDLAPLEKLAVKGELPAEATACLDARLAESAGKTQSRISRVLMVDAYARGDMATWERRLLHHLTAIEATDPDLAHKFALHRSRAETLDGWKGDPLVGRRARAPQRVVRRAAREPRAIPVQASGRGAGALPVCGPRPRGLRVLMEVRRADVLVVGGGGRRAAIAAGMPLARIPPAVG